MSNPLIIENDGRVERTYDIYSRLLKDRIIFLGSDVNPNVANSIVAQLLYLESESSEKDITLYINSPGGEVSSGLAIYDTMQHVKANISTICVGMAASMGAVLLAAGTKGKRYALEHSKVMIHQPLGGARGQATDIGIIAKEILRIKSTMENIMAKHTGQNKERLREDMERDNYMTSEEAKEYGIIDHILKKEG